MESTRTLMRLFAITSLLALILAACTPVAPSSDGGNQADRDSLVPITLGVGYVPNVQFAPLYVGIEKGFFRDAGLEVNLEYGYENDYLKLVGTNQAQFMVGSGDQVVIGRAQGLPVRYVMTWYTKYPVVIFSTADAGIVEPADLTGKSVGIPGPFGASYVAYRGILESAGLSERDVKMESIGFTQAAAVASGAVDAAVDYAVNGPVVLAQEGIETNLIVLDDHLRIPANGLITNDQTIRDNPELVSAMVAAMIRSIKYALDNPDEAFEITLKYVPEASGENRPINRAVFDASREYWRPAEGAQFGESRLADWQTTSEFIQRINLVDVTVDADTLFTNEFLP
jgi:NitT/TauT family transport system substrate-binding protein